MKKILVVEDDKSVRAGIVDLLREEGFLVSIAENGKEGLEYARENLPDLIISDIVMPEMDGTILLEELKKEIKTADIPFIFLSAKSSLEEIKMGIKLGADDYLIKPYKIDHLLDAVNSRLEKALQK